MRRKADLPSTSAWNAKLVSCRSFPASVAPLLPLPPPFPSPLFILNSDSLEGASP